MMAEIDMADVRQLVAKWKAVCDGQESELTRLRAAIQEAICCGYGPYTHATSLTKMKRVLRKALAATGVK